MQSILLDICGQMRTYKQRQCQKKGKRVIEKAKQYIKEHYKEEQLNLSQVSEAIGLSAVYFCSLFKEETGHTLSLIHISGSIRFRHPYKRSPVPTLRMEEKDSC